MGFTEGLSFEGRSDSSCAFKQLLQALGEQYDRDLAKAAAQGSERPTDAHPSYEVLECDRVQALIQTPMGPMEPEPPGVVEAAHLRACAEGPLVHSVPSTRSDDLSTGAPTPSSVRAISKSMKQAARLTKQDTINFGIKRSNTGRKSANARTSAIGKFVGSHRFDHISACLLISNALFIGVQVEFEFTETTPVPILAIDYIFCCLFVVELALRMWSSGCYHFWLGADERGWNWFDFCIVGLTALDVFISILMQGQSTLFDNISVLRIVRMIRITRVLRILRVMKVFEDLRVLMLAIVSTLKTGVYAFMLIATAMWIFGIAITQLVAAHVGEQKSLGKHISPDSDLLHYFGSLWKSVLVLYMTISGGIDWKDAAFPLYETTPLGVALFFVYTLLMILCVMNVLTGLFVHAAIESANQDTESVIQFQMAERHRYIDLLRNLFDDLDHTGNGRCSFREFEMHLSDSKIQALLESLDIEIRDAMAIFELFDNDGSGEIDLDEFITGCITLRGSAKAVQMEKLKNMSGDLEFRIKGLERNLRNWQRSLEKSLRPLVAKAA
eukprot:TRINITY_DN29277_c0_g1_i1.p1 TRINITY_DN29277_c0_g1~~TRINITY_DN29277_c0_g1_i1.p1  ORF type:complete len:555 (-),score=74.20 TRINITY_DN29277_c0_g1_i1:96-1760(-)